MKALLKKLTPKIVLHFYHRLLAQAADFYYGHPSGKMIVIGVTGTKGKSTTCHLMAKILEEAGYKVGLTSTAMFKIGEREWINPYKMTMLGRFSLQRLLKKMVDVGCRYAIVETSSEGIKQFRHLGIDYDVAVMTNLAPEHIESHGSFEKYREAKAKLFKSIKYKVSSIKYFNGKPAPKIIIINGDDKSAEWCSRFEADEKIIYGITNKSSELQVTSYKLQANGIDFEINGLKFSTGLMGEFNLYNILAAIAVALSQGINLEICRRAIEKIKVIPGRFEFIDEGQPFKVVVDYAHNPSSFQALYATINLIPHQRLIHVFGATGGGRDKTKRPIMGEMAASHAEVVIVTTDDPYEENLHMINQQVMNGIKDGAARIKEGRLFEIIDRREAIRKAIELARGSDIVLITGKGCEQKMAIGGKMIPWDDRAVVRGLLKGLTQS